MNGYGGGIAMWCHVVDSGYFVELFTCVNVALRESEVSHSFEEYYVVHTTEGAFEIRVSRVCVFFDILASSYTMMCVERLSYIFLCRLKPSAVSLRMPCASTQGEPMFVRMEVHSLSMPFISAIGL